LISGRFISGKAQESRLFPGRDHQCSGQFLGQLPRGAQFIRLDLADGLAGVANLLTQLRLGQAQAAAT
jgi:hypothetical protein